MLHSAVAPSLPAFAVTHTIVGHFAERVLGESGTSKITNEEDKQIIVIRHNHITLYNVNTHYYQYEHELTCSKSEFEEEEEEEQISKETRKKHKTLQHHTNTSTSCMLEHTQAMTFLMECDLHAPPIDAQVCRPSNVNVDLLMLLFDDYHISLLQYNSIIRKLDTVALIQLDDRGCALQRCTLPPLLRVDPTKTHVAVLVKRTELFYFTVKQRIDKDDAAAMTPEKSNNDVNPSSHASAAVSAAIAAAANDNVTQANAKANKKDVELHKQSMNSKQIATITEKKTTRVSMDAWGDDDDDDDDYAKIDEGEKNANSEEDEPISANFTENEVEQREQQEQRDMHAEVNEETTNNNHVYNNEYAIKDDVRKAVSMQCSHVVLISEITHIHLRDVNNALRNIRDVCFVESSTEPLLAVLYEKDPTWAGRVKLIEWRSRTVESNMLTCSVMWLRASSAFHLAAPSNTHKNTDNNNNSSSSNKNNISSNKGNSNLNGKPEKEVTLLPIGEIDYLPYDVTHMLALPAYHNTLSSSVLIFSASIIIHVTTTSGFGVYLNANGKEAIANVRQSSNIMYNSVHWGDKSQARSLSYVKTNLNLANCTAQLIHNDESIMNGSVSDKHTHSMSSLQESSLSSSSSSQLIRSRQMELLVFTEDYGTVVVLTLHVTDHAISSMSLRIIMTECFCSCAAWLHENLYFVGSANGDSHVIAYSSHENIATVKRGNSADRMTGLRVIQTFTGLCPVMDAAVIESVSAIETSKRLTQPNKRLSDNNNNNDNNNERKAVNEMPEFLDTSIATSPFAPLFHEIILDPESTLTVQHLSEGSGQMDVLLCSGLRGAGSLSILRQSIRDHIVRREQINAVSLFYISCESDVVQSMMHKRARDTDLAAATMETVKNVARAHLVMTGIDFTLLFTIRGDSVQQVLGTMINVNTRTVAAFFEPHTSVIVQVTETELYLTTVDGKRLMHHVNLGTMLSDAISSQTENNNNSLANNEEQQQQQEQLQTSNVNESPTDATVSVRSEKVQSAFVLPSLSSILILFDSGILCTCSLIHNESTNANVNDSKRDNAISTRLTILMHDIVACNVWNTSSEEQHASFDNQREVVVITKTLHLMVIHIDNDKVETILHFPHFAIMPEFAVNNVPATMHKLPARLRGEKLPLITHIHVFPHDCEPNTSNETDKAHLKDIHQHSHVQYQYDNEEQEETLERSNNDTQTKLSASTLEKCCSVVCILSSGEMIAYKYIPPDTYGPARLIKYLYHFLDIKPERDVYETIEAKRKRLVEERAHLEEDAFKLRHCSNRIVPFTSIAGHRGVYLCGRHPVFLFLHPLRNELVMCRHNVHSLVRGFAPFRSRHLRSGYVYCCEGAAYFAMSENDVLRAKDKTNKLHNGVHDKNNSSTRVEKEKMITEESEMELLTNGWWLIRRIWLNATPHQAVYHGPSHTCFVSTARSIPFGPRRASFDVQLHIKYDEEGNVSASVEEPISLPPLQASITHAPVPMNDKYVIQLFSCATWQLLDTFDLEDNEKVLTASEVCISRDASFDANTHIGKTSQQRSLEYSTNNNNKTKTISNNITNGNTKGELFVSSKAPICVIGTAFPLGEDVTTRGRLILLTVQHISSVTSNTTSTQERIRMLSSEPMKGPVTALCEIQGDIALAVGGTLRVLHYDWVTRTLETNALLYANVYVTSLSSIKDYLFYGDLHYSVALCRYSSMNHTLTPLAKDVHSMSIVHCNSLYHQHAFGLLFSDDERNLCVCGYTPRVRMSSNTNLSGSTMEQVDYGKNNNNSNGDSTRFDGVLIADSLTKSNTQSSNQYNTKSINTSNGSSNNNTMDTERKVLESLLTIDGEYRMASGCVVKMLRFRLNQMPSSAALYFTNTGEVGFVVALGEQTNQTAQWISRRLQSELPHLAGLPPKMFLGFGQDDPQRGLSGKEHLIHTPLLNQFFRLDLQMRKLLALSALTQLDRVLNAGATINIESNIV